MKTKLYTIIFIIITAILFINLSNILIPKYQDVNTRQYYIEKDIDVMFLGTSIILYAMSPMEIWNKYGIISYNKASSGQYYKLTTSLLEQIIIEKKPKLVIVDINLRAFTLTEYLTDTTILTQYNIFNIYKSMNDVYGNSLENNLERMNVTNRFNTRWKNLTQDDFITESYLKGCWLESFINGRLQKKHEIRKNTPSNIVITNEELDNFALKDNVTDFVLSLKSIADKYGTDILFVSLPFPQFKSSVMSNMVVEKLSEEKKLNFINYNKLYDIINIDFSRDFRDSVHLNLYGSRKVMDHLIPYIIEHYNIPNRKNDPEYASWNEDYIKYARVINREEIRALNSLNEWQKQAFYDNYTMLISTNGDDVLNRLSQDMKDKFKSLGLNKFETDKKNQKYAAIIDNNQVFFEEVSDKKVEYKGRMKNIVNLLVSSEPNKATINVSGKPRAKNKYGINFVIYDKVNREIVDSIWVDPAKLDVVRR